MADPATATVVEEHHVTGFQLVALDHRCVEVDQLASGARQLETCLLAEQEADEAAAVETALHRAATVAIRNTDQGEAAPETAVSQLPQLVGVSIGTFCQRPPSALDRQ